MLNVEVFYLGHSSWLVKTNLATYIFDYADCINEAKSGGPENGFVDLSLMSKEKVFLLSSHDHHDHYSKRLHDNAKNYSNITSMLGGINLNPREIKVFGETTINTAASTDKGVCFLVEQKDGLSIFHGGDNADWDDDSDGLYYKEIDYIAEINGRVDIAFIPVCTFNGICLQSLAAGALYAIKKLNPTYVFPMHGNGREVLYKEFYKNAPQTVQRSIICAENIGQKFNL